MSDDVNKSNRNKLLLVLVVFALPIVLSYLAYYVWPPAGGVKNYGELVKGAVLPESNGLMLWDGKPAPSLRGKWWLVVVDTGACDAVCEKKLYAVRQARLLQGREMDRVERLWVVNGAAAPDAALLKRFEGTVAVRDSAGVVLPKLPAVNDARDHIYLIDTLGNVVLRYGADPDLKRMKKDLELLLRASQIG